MSPSSLPTSGAGSDAWIVLKFGGTSVSKRHRWDTIGRIAYSDASVQFGALTVVEDTVREALARAFSAPKRTTRPR